MNKHLRQFKNFVKDKNKKCVFTIFKEVTVLWTEIGSFPLHYFTRYAYKKDAGYYKDYVDLGLAKKIWSNSSLHDNDCCNLLRDKLAFERFARTNNISTPYTLCYSDGQSLQFNNQTYSVQSFEEFKTFMLNVLPNDVFIKPKDGIQGKNCFKVILSETDDEYLTKIFETIKGNRFLFQNLIVQHPDISAIYPNSINTLRIDTYKDEDGIVHILTPFMRLGRGNSVTDNTSNDGFIVPVDLEKGMLFDYGIQYLNVGTNYIYQHPDTQVLFKGRSIPFSKETEELVKRAASSVTDKLIGWDVAISIDGPLIVEGNCDYAMAGQDIIRKGYKRHPIFRKMLIENGL